MNVREAGFLLLTSRLGNPDRKVLTTAQLRTLGERMRYMSAPEEDRDLETGDLIALGYGYDTAARILALLEETELLEYYLRRAEKLGCTPISRVSGQYPQILKDRLGQTAPGCLWAKGDLSILDTPRIALVGSRDLDPVNAGFAAEVGRQAALQGFTLVSGNARGADRTAQNACLKAGGAVISIVADSLAQKTLRQRILYISEDDFDEDFSAQRALSRNRLIHCLGEKTFVAQSAHQTGGTWDGTVKNLRFGWSPVFCFDDGSCAAQALCQMGAEPVTGEALADLSGLQEAELHFFDR
mgnify:CR=1 FL=1